MPYFSFSIKKNFLANYSNDKIDSFKKLKLNTKYYSKNTRIWKVFNNLDKSNFNSLIKEKRTKIFSIDESILFFLPPNIGLGDAIEYGLSIKSILINKNYKKIGVAFTEEYKLVFEKYFNIKNTYDYFISEEEYLKNKTIFHFTLQINELKFQKYNKEDKEININKFFNVKEYRNTKIQKVKKFNTISIFPISKSPIRTMPINLINKLILELSRKYKLEILLDPNSDISNFIEKNIIINKNTKIIKPNILSEFLKYLENIDFGIFMDSGPIHVAKILGLQGILVVSSVDKKKLLNKFNSITAVDNNYKSNYCSSPCGLVNLFNYSNNVGCYDSLQLKKNKFLEIKNLKNLQRGSLKKNYQNFIINPVNCLKKIDCKKIVKLVERINK